VDFVSGHCTIAVLKIKQSVLKETFKNPKGIIRSRNSMKNR
jgi:hypothetical protein